MSNANNQAAQNFAKIQLSQFQTFSITIGKTMNWIYATAVAIMFALLVFDSNALAQQKNESTSVNQRALKRIVKRAEASESDALIIWKEGELVGEWFFDKPRGRIEAMSATKSVVVLAFGLLLSDGRLKSLDEPVCNFYPEWKQGLKSRITIRHLLTQMSGLQCERRTTAIYQAPDFVQFGVVRRSCRGTWQEMAVQQQRLQSPAGNCAENLRQTDG